VQRAILARSRRPGRKDYKKRVIPGAVAAPPTSTKSAPLSDTLKRDANDDDLYASLMYRPCSRISRSKGEFSDVSVLPTQAYFYGLKLREEITITIEQARASSSASSTSSEPDKDGRRAVTTNSTASPARSSSLTRRLLQGPHPAQGDLADPLQSAAPIPASSRPSVTVGQKVAKGDKLLMMEAMKMQTTSSLRRWVVDALYPASGDTVESKDLLVKLRAV